MQEDVNELKKKIERLKMRVTEAQARNYELRYSGMEKPSIPELKARIEWLETEIKRVVSQRDELRKQLGK